ncbi:dihydrolipoyl dehydrogenase [Puniceibacterium confluentis]|uniref:dihydrolipoyl dehydrogenase n=1 Tax=Puniceibacterium confluentis TaxID=1958944 RepID=UPI0011B54BA3|nr:dihydrolipoyl dehydrogenase [Puniceibacterium confluentis]
MEIKVPDIGDFKDVPVVTILVAVGDTVAKEDALIELESDKATLEVPSPAAGKVIEIKVKEGDKVSEGTVFMVFEGAESGDAPKEAPKAEATRDAPTSVAASGTATGKGDVHGEVVVLGSGPGGYTAAFRAADLGKSVVLIEKYPNLGGVCLNVGCIPSKALLHVAKVITEAEEMQSHGVSFGKPKVDLDALRAFKSGVVSQLTGGLSGLSKARKVKVVQGYGRFTGPNMIAVEGDDGATTKVSFDQCIIAAGSEPVNLPFIPHDDPRVIDSTGALELKDIPKRMLVLGGGIIGLEMACVYDALGSRVTVVEFMDQLMPGADKDMVKPLHKRIEGRYEKIMLKTKVTNVEAQKAGLKVTFEDDKGEVSSDTFDKVLVSVGRRPNGKLIDAGAAGVAVDDRGFIAVDGQQRTGVAHIFAIGDVVGQPMLAHKAVHEGKVAAEVCAGEKRFFDAQVIPSVAYTDPEVAWVGLTETEAKAKGVKYEKGVFPWAASGRSLANGRSEGMTKVLFDPEDQRVIGASIVGTNAGDLISEVALAIEMGADAVDLGHTIHPHPTLSETVNFAAEMYEGTITDLMPPKKKKH